MNDFVDSVATLVGVRDRDDLERTLASVMFELVGASALTVWRTARRDGPRTFLPRLRLGADETLPAVAKALRPDQLGPVSRLALESRRQTSRLDANGAGTHAFPVLDGEDAVGVVELRRAPALSGGDEKLIEGLIRIYRSHLGVLDQTHTDELTGLDNRKPFEDAFRRLSRTAFTPRPRGEVAVVDIDHFKRVNDTFGHVYGDEVLVLVAGILKRGFRDQDRVFRFGGEEFAVLLADVTPGQAERALERFRACVEEARFPQVGRVTVSIGVTTIVPDETGLEAFGRADEALYMAKNDGRNRLRRYETLIAQGRIFKKPKHVEKIELF
jgi:diguanylate cyclase (GGDEF)-like protein